MYPFLLKPYADGGYKAPAFRAGVRRVCREIEVEIVKRFDTAKGFVLRPGRWLVKRTIAGLNRCRLAKDWDCLTRKALVFLHFASICLMPRKICQNSI